MVALIDSLTNYPELNLYVYDIDLDEYKILVNRNINFKSHGVGETFWINKGEIAHFLSKYTIEDRDKLISYNESIITMSR